MLMCGPRPRSNVGSMLCLIHTKYDLNSIVIHLGNTPTCGYRALVLCQDDFHVLDDGESTPRCGTSELQESMVQICIFSCIFELTNESMWPCFGCSHHWPQRPSVEVPGVGDTPY